MKHDFIKTFVVFAALFVCNYAHAQQDSTAMDSTKNDTAKIVNRTVWVPIIKDGIPNYLPIDSLLVLKMKAAKYLNQSALNFKAAYITSMVSTGCLVAASLSNTTDAKYFFGTGGATIGLTSIILTKVGINNMVKASDIMMMEVCPSCLKISFRIK